MDLTLSAVLTAAGAVTAAALVSGLVEIAKRLAPVIGRRQLEPVLAFALSAALVATAWYSAGIYTAESGFAALLAWYGIARVSMGLHDDVTGAPSGIRAP